MRGKGEVPATIAAAERWRQVGRELRALAPEVYEGALRTMEALIASATLRDESIDETSTNC